MFNPKILQQLKELNINTITNAIKEVERMPLLGIETLSLYVKPPYFFLKIFDNEKAQINKLLRNKAVIGFITINGITTLILYYSTYKEQQAHMSWHSEHSSDCYKSICNLNINHNDKVKVWHKPNKKSNCLNTSAKTSIIDELAELSKKPNNLFYFNYAKKHPYFYLYRNPLINIGEAFKDFKFFKLYCTLLFIAENSNTIKFKKNQCHISPQDLAEIIPSTFKNNINRKQPRKKEHSKQYINFLNLACKTGMIADYELKDDYILITFSKQFMDGLSEPPYTKIPFSIINDITKHNYMFIMYFINKQFSNNPANSYFINIKIKELLKVSGISLSTSNAMAVKRLNSYIALLEKYHVIIPELWQTTAATYVSQDIHRNKLITFRLYHFSLNSLDYSNSDDDCDEDDENIVDVDIDSKEKPSLSPIFIKANELIDKRPSACN